MFRKDPAAMEEWSLDAVRLCAARQRRIVHDVWDALSPGGLFVYSTCTYNTMENEDNILHIMNEYGAEPLPIVTPTDMPVGGALAHTLPVSRFFPDNVRGEGFFMAALRKPDGNRRPVSCRVGKRKAQSAAVSPFSDIIHTSDKYMLTEKNGAYFAVGRRHYDDVCLLMPKLEIQSAGIGLGMTKGSDIIPAHALAMSTALNVEAFDKVALSYDEAISYLRRESLQSPVDGGKGYALVTFDSLPLGFIKRIGTRANNLYPTEWRIRQSIVPSEPVSIYAVGDIPK
jgi:NOL1/NOP2/fmu family ribosome biogenesis protein